MDYDDIAHRLSVAEEKLAAIEQSMSATPFSGRGDLPYQVEALVQYSTQLRNQVYTVDHVQAMATILELGYCK